MLRRMVKHQLAGVVAVVGVASISLQPLAASGINSPASMNGWTGNPVFSSASAVNSRRLPQVTPAALARARQDLTAQKFSRDVRTAAKADRLLKILDVITAGDAQERHSRVLALHVTVRAERPTDGRNGIIKTFIARGVARTHIFVPSRIVEVADPQPDISITGDGPSAESTGRWKSDGQGGCYWDPYDSGSNQCDPTGGRWKSDGHGGCYYANDTGPDQCTPPDTGQTCTDDYATGPCATEQEIEDAQATLAAMEAEADDYEDTCNDEYGLYQDYCDQYPQNCDEPEILVSGPSAFDATGGCFDQAEDAALSIGEMAVGLPALEAAAAVGVSTLGLGFILGGAFLLGYNAGRGIRKFIECRQALPALLLEEWHLHQPLPH